ncbi:MFS family permease [Rhodococcus sp. 27YEA15]|uniref:MFS transporter n=1 Tax=Rhodococcus sp. 27YEA15 TaxID=3156259 RepID=UPI003C7D1D1D
MTTNEVAATRPVDMARIKMARFATFFGFFQLGSLMLMWSTSTSSLRAAQGWEGESGDSKFGMLALAIGVGATVGCLAIGPLLDRFGPRAAARPVYLLYPLSYVALAFVDGLTAAILTGVMVGLLRGASSTASNVHGVQVERYYGRPIMSAFHAAYPAGGFLLGLVGSALARHFTDSPTVAYLTIGGVMAVLGFVASKWLLTRSELLPPEENTNTETSAKTRPTSTATLLILIGFGILLLASMLSENALLDWGQEFVRRTTGTTAGLAAAAVTFYSGAQFAGRLFGDKLAEKFGARAIVGASGAIGSAGALLALLGHSTPLALVGFVLLGLGLACIAPLMLSAAGRRDPENAGRNIGIVNAIGYSGMLVGPAAITILVDTTGIQWMPIVPAILLALIAVGGPALTRLVPNFDKPVTTTTKDGREMPIG